METGEQIRDVNDNLIVFFIKGMAVNYILAHQLDPPGLTMEIKKYGE